MKGPAFLYVVRVADSDGHFTLFGTFTSIEIARGFIEAATDDTNFEGIHLRTDEVERAEILTVNNVWR